jgi:ammonia channel protein AmtB
MAAFLTLAVWFAALGVAWWLWARTVGDSEPARPVINAVFVLLGMLLVWFLLFGEVPTFMHF